MARLILSCLLFLASMVNFFPVPAKQVWYVGIAVPEYAYIFVIAALICLVWTAAAKRFRLACSLLLSAALLIFCSPIVRAFTLGDKLKKDLETSFPVNENELPPFHQKKPFSFGLMFSGHHPKQIPVQHFEYAVHSGEHLDLNFSASAVPGIRPCLVVVHGGSWKRGDFTELAHFNNYFANAGYQVATINYRLAPKFASPAQAEDIHAAIAWLKANAGRLNIDTNNFVLTGRSAGAQLVLAAAYSGIEKGVKGVAAFYGPTDMFWTFDHPDNKLIMDSREVQRDFLGGTPQSARDRYFAESPLLHVTANSVPTLLVHGEQDAHVYHEQSVRLAEKLKKENVKCVFLSIPWATHGCEFNLNGPSGQLAIYATERFLRYVTTH